MADEGTWHGSKEPAKRAEPIKLLLDDEPRESEPLNLGNIEPMGSEQNLESQMAAVEQRNDDPWRFFPVMLSAIVCGWLIITALEAITAAVVINMAAEKAETEMQRATEEFERAMKKFRN